jgi:hypothetical protein
VPPADGEAEQGTLAEGCDELGLTVGGVPEEQHVRPVVHGGQDRQCAQELLGANGDQDQDQVEAVVGADLADAPDR